MQPGFDVLDRQLDLFSSHFLEASAGTGKTFAIENLFVRMILAEESVSVDQILVVTFTRAATLDLKTRIRAHLEKTFFLLQNKTHLPDYLLSLVEKGDADVSAAQRKLKQALALFDEAKIFTIHGFCFHALQENALEAGLSLDQKEETSSLNILERVVKDYLRAEIHEEDFTPQQFQFLLKKYRNDIDSLISALLEIATKKIPIETSLSLQEWKQRYLYEIHRLKQLFPIDRVTLEEDLKKQAPLYKNLCDQKKQLKKDSLEGIRDFCSSFETSQPPSSPLILKFRSDNQSKRTQPIENLVYPHLLHECEKALMPLIEDYFDTLSVFAKLAEGVRKRIESIIQEEDLLFFDDLIYKMREKVKDSHFIKSIQSAYKAVFIDEFQDTDPKQWEIFSSLFLSSFNGPLYLVGDPKQSIYRFREADIYTYLNAKNSFPQNRVYSLDYNYRSSPSLIQALNHLMTSTKTFIPLPRWNQYLTCPPLKIPPGKTEEPFKDGRGSIHFLKASTENGLFEAIASEIFSFHENEKIPYSAMAILVKDRFQLSRFQTFCQKIHLPLQAKNNRLLYECESYRGWIDLLEALLYPQEKERFLKVLGGPFCRYSHHEIEEKSQLFMQNFYSLKIHFEERGIFSFFDAFLHIVDSKYTLFSRPSGIEIYNDSLQLMEMVALEEKTLDAALHCLKQLKKNEALEACLARPVPGSEGVNLLTIHMSKGLEYAVVFPIGLILETHSKKELVLDHELHAFTLRPEAQNLHALELDAEKMRQFYVAVTRAKRRLYLPLLSSMSREDKKGTLSPMTLFLQQFENQEFVSQLVETSEQTITLSHYEEGNITPFKEHISFTLIPPSNTQKVFKSEKIHSFSSLATKKALTTYAQEGIVLPSGADMGNKIHQLLERIPFDDSLPINNETEFERWLEPYIEALELKQWQSEVNALIYRALTTPLTHLNLPLCRVDTKKIRREMEFVYEDHKGLFKGFIDLFFECDGKYYILDWKTNFLGMHLGDYSQNALETCMTEHDYYLQASIYTKAIHKYLSLFDLEDKFSGTYYVFLRGLPSGILFIPKESCL